MFDPKAIERIRAEREAWEAGEVAREGVAVDTIEDVEALFAGIDLEKISVSMTINPTAWILLAMYVAVAQARGFDLNKLSGTVQADILKEYIAQKEWIFPIRPSMRLMRDMIVFCARSMARYNPVNVSGYHISEAGATSVQEVAFTMANGIAFVEEVTRSGVAVDAFAPRLAFYFVAQADFFAEAAKFRAARRVWARIMKERFGATKAESMRLRFHCQTAAATLTRAQPMNNVVRTALQALSAVLGGAQSLHTNGLDEAYAIPSELAMKIALRTQQVIADETRVTSVVDPLGGSYYVEALTNRIEAAVMAILKRVDALGGTVKAIEEGYFQREIADSAYEHARRKASGEQPVIGVNKFVEPAEPGAVEIHRVDPAVEARQVARLRATRALREAARNERVFGMKVAEIMTRDVITGSPHDDLLTVAHTMTEKRIRHLPVVDKGRLVGIVSIGDIVKTQRDKYQGELDTLQAQLLGDEARRSL